MHTPAPWKHCETYGLIKYGKTEIAALHSGNPDNARLIVAAPDLLAALQELVAEFDERHAHEDHRTGYTLDTAGIAAARAAISKVYKKEKI